MPAPPEIWNRSGKIRTVEISHKSVTHHLGTTYCYIGISGEITVNLKGKEDGGNQQTRTVELIGLGVDIIDQQCQSVSYDHLLK